MQSARGSEALEEALKRVGFEVYRSGLPQSNIHQVIESALDRAVSYRMGLQSCQAVVGRLESVLEPRVMDLDGVASSLRAAMSELGAVCATVPPATEALVAQAQTLEELESAIRAEIAQRAAA